MAEEETKVEAQNKTSDQKSCCAGSNHTAKVVLIVVGIVLVLGALGAAAKIAFFRHTASGWDRGLAMMNGYSGNYGYGMMGRSGSFAGGRTRMMGNFDDDNESRFALSGTISAISGDKLTVKSSSKNQIVNITADTSIVKSGAIAAKGDLAQNDTVVVSGTSNSAGEIVATFIRVK